MFDQYDDAIKRILPRPQRLVPDRLIPAARDLYMFKPDYAGTNHFRQSRGPLCYSNAHIETQRLRGIAAEASILAIAASDLADWMQAASSLGSSERTEP